MDRNCLRNKKEDEAPQRAGKGDKEKGEGQTVLPIEIKTFTSCKERLLHSPGSACSMSHSVLAFTNTFPAILCGTNSVS